MLFAQRLNQLVEHLESLKCRVAELDGLVVGHDGLFHAVEQAGGRCRRFLIEEALTFDRLSPA